MSKSKILDDNNFKESQFNVERARWEDFHRWIRIEINKQEHLPEAWLIYLFENFPVNPANASDIIFPPEFISRVVALPAAANASNETQRNRNDTIRRDERHNEVVRKSKAIFVDILSSCVSTNLKNIFHDAYNIQPYQFYAYLKTSFGPESNQNEDKSTALHQIITMTMGHTETFTSFMTKFNHKADYLKLKSGAKRGLLTTTLANTHGKFQLLPDRLIEELKHARKTDMNFREMVAWLTQQDINQMNDGLKILKVKKIIADDPEEKGKKIFNHKEKDKELNNMIDPNGLLIRVSYRCYNCQNYGHSSKDCMANFCYQCETVRPGHKSNICPCPKSKKRSMPKRKTTGELKKGKGDTKPDARFKPKKGVKMITTSSYETDEDNDESLRNGADSEYDDHDSVEASDEDLDNSRRKRGRSQSRIRTIKFSDTSRTFVRKTSVKCNAQIEGDIRGYSEFMRQHQSEEHIS